MRPNNSENTTAKNSSSLKTTNLPLSNQAFFPYNPFNTKMPLNSYIPFPQNLGNVQLNPLMLNNLQNLYLGQGLQPLGNAFQSTIYPTNPLALSYLQPNYQMLQGVNLPIPSSGVQLPVQSVAQSNSTAKSTTTPQASKKCKRTREVTKQEKRKKANHVRSASSSTARTTRNTNQVQSSKRLRQKNPTEETLQQQKDRKSAREKAKRFELKNLYIDINNIVAGIHNQVPEDDLHRVEILKNLITTLVTLYHLELPHVELSSLIGSSPEIRGNGLNESDNETDPAEETAGRLISTNSNLSLRSGGSQPRTKKRERRMRRKSMKEKERRDRIKVLIKVLGQMLNTDSYTDRNLVLRDAKSFLLTNSRRNF